MHVDDSYKNCASSVMTQIPVSAAGKRASAAKGVGLAQNAEWCAFRFRPCVVKSRGKDDLSSCFTRLLNPKTGSRKVRPGTR